MIAPMFGGLAFGGPVMTSVEVALSDRTRSELHHVAHNAAVWFGFGGGLSAQFNA